MDTWTDLIDALGTRRETGEALGVASTTVQSWKQRGIPAGYWLRVQRYADTQTVPVTLLTLAQWAERDALG